MNTTPTPEELAAIAAKLDPKLSPDEAVERAHALWAAADKALSATQIANDEEERKLRVKAAILERVGLNLPDDEGISLSQAFKLQQDIASRVGISPYKNEDRFIAALREAGLTDHRDISAEWLIPAGSTFRVWREIKESKTPRPSRETQELTSERAIRELFKRKADRRRQLEGNRKRKARAKSTTQDKNSKNNARTIEAKKRTGISKKRTSDDQKRT